MAALTLVMNELIDMDADDFFHVRAYHSCSKDCRGNLRIDIPLLSPTSSESSGLGSLTSSTNSDQESDSDCSFTVTSKASSKALREKLETDIFNQLQDWPKRTLEKFDQRIIYLRRDILNLDANIRPLQWQLISPLCDILKSRLYGYCKSLCKCENESMIREYITEKCKSCDFYQPLFRN